ncbi:MAG: flagellar basal body rod protein FlgC [Bdellovibrionales bacterium]|nr:flagellar basal body rod protein FlgC [Bdellovibrionales bacterium]
MDFLTGLRVSGSGMTAQRRRMNAITSNIANINTTQTPEGGPYRRKQVIMEAMPEAKTFSEMMLTNPEKNVNRVQVVDVVSDRKAPLLKYEPDHPEADENGYVAYPNIDLMTEMADMIQASRSYEANVSALNATKDMALKALEIGR